MRPRVARFAGEYAVLAAWSGTPEPELQSADGDHPGHDRWIAWDGHRMCGVVDAWQMPDDRLRLFFGRCEPPAYAGLADAITAPCYATVSSDNHDALRELPAAGFTELRRENEYEIPVAMRDIPVPAGIRIITADQTELEPLMMLDCAIRADIPGSDGWQPDPVWFRAETYDAADFDPQAYLVALDGEAYVGLVRIWRRSGAQMYRRLGCVGVLAEYRRHGLARALIARALIPLAAAGETAVTAEADTSNVASHSLLTGFAGRVTGSTVEFFRDAKTG